MQVPEAETPSSQKAGVGVVWELEDGNLVCRGVVPGSPATQSCPPILNGDVLLSIDGEEINVENPSQVVFVANRLLGKAGTHVTLGLCRPVSYPIQPSELAWLLDGNGDYFLGTLGDLPCATFHVDLVRDSNPVQRARAMRQDDQTLLATDPNRRFMF